MKTFSISEAKRQLGSVADQALHGETVIIVRKSRLLMLQEYQPLEGIPLRPPGYFKDVYTKAEVKELNRLAKKFSQTPGEMKQWDIYLFAFDQEGPHPAVIISNAERCENPDLGTVNVLLCTSAKLNRGPKPTEIILDESDGLDWKTAARCDVIYLVEKSGFQEARGSVTPLRRKLLTRKILECLRLPL